MYIFSIYIYIYITGSESRRRRHGSTQQRGLSTGPVRAAAAAAERKRKRDKRASITASLRWERRPSVCVICMYVYMCTQRCTVLRLHCIHSYSYSIVCTHTLVKERERAPSSPSMQLILALAHVSILMCAPHALTCSALSYTAAAAAACCCCWWWRDEGEAQRVGRGARPVLLLSYTLPTTTTTTSTPTTIYYYCSAALYRDTVHTHTVYIYIYIYQCRRRSMASRLKAGAPLAAAAPLLLMHLSSSSQAARRIFSIHSAATTTSHARCRLMRRCR